MPDTVVEPATLDAPRDRRRSLERRAAVGFLGGVALGGVVSALHFAWAGYRVFPMPTALYLIWFPALITSFALGRDPALRSPQARLNWRNLRISTRVCMVVVAYLAVLMGVFSTLSRLGLQAGIYHGRAVNAHHMATVFHTLADKAERDARTRLESARTLREGRVSTALLHEQQTFLRSLDGLAEPEYRRQRYGIIADSEESQGKLAEHNAPGYRNLARYYEGMATKYDRAERQPWVPVAPDPPEPTFR